MNRIELTAHSGCEDSERDSLKSVEYALEVGADCLEVDVRMDPAGRLVISHNAREDYSDANTLEQVFCMIRGTGCAINCDLKEPRTLYPVLALAEKCGLAEGQLVFSGSVSCDLLAADPSITERARIYLNGEEVLKYILGCPRDDLKDHLEHAWKDAAAAIEANGFDGYIPRISAAAKSLGVTVINMPFDRLTHESIEAFRAEGVELSLWTVDKEADMARLLQENLKNITTRQIRMGMRLRNVQ